jgi:hypothetical protein
MAHLKATFKIFLGLDQFFMDFKMPILLDFFTSSVKLAA